MNDEAAFLATIGAAPKNATARLVYADWLDEKGDARGELVRIEEEMRELPVFADRYWLLKTRRNTLSELAPKDWLETMGYGTVCRPIFVHGFPDGWKERWRLIREFMERWHQLPLGDVGGRTDEIHETEARLGHTLPPSVREWVAFAHDMFPDDVRRDQPVPIVLRDVYLMEELDDHPVISLLLQCEGDYHWAVRHDDLALPDPPVHGFHWDFENLEDSDGSTFESTFVPDKGNPIAPAVSAFALEYVLGCTNGEGGGFSTEVADPAELIRNLAAAFPARCRVGQAEFFEAENLLVRLSPSHRGTGQHIVVEVAKPMPREAVPSFLWDCTHNGGAFHGMFTPERRRHTE